MSEQTDNKYLKQDVPLYGTIPYMGGEWSVTFKAKVSTTSHATGSLSGYGAFPFERFPGLPVINYYKNDAVFASLKLKDSDRPNEQNPAYGGTLAGFLEKVKDLGIEVINYPVGA